jgi:hypothetical protein
MTKAKIRYIDFPSFAWYEWFLLPIIHLKLMAFQDYLNNLEKQGYKIEVVRKLK